jgi:parallel beta-helix repeat protein
MQARTLTSLVLGAGLATGLAGCGDNGNNNPNGDAFAVNNCKAVTTGTCMEIASTDSAALLTAANTITDNTTLVLGAGTFQMTNQLTLRNKGVHLIGQGIDKTTLNFGATTTQGNGVDVVGDGFLLQDVTVLDAGKDGIRVEDTKGVTFRRIRATWTKESDPNNGSYGIYPVKSQNVLVEDSKAENASDAGLYVGQCQHVIVRNNTVMGNVAGLEIENTEYADVYGNTAVNNTGGIVVFDLPGNPIIGRDVRLRDNMIHDNNHVNFASGGTVAMIPVGTGTFAMASRRVEITGNTYANNNTGDIALISGLAIESDLTKWTLPTASIVGTYADLNLLPGPTAGTVMNFRGENIVVANNHHSGSGTKPDLDDPLHLGALLTAIYAKQPVDNVLYDAIGETKFSVTVPADNTNDNRMCLGGNTGGTFASMNLAAQATSPGPFFRPTSPFAPFDCTTLVGGAVAEVVLP